MELNLSVQAQKSFQKWVIKLRRKRIAKKFGLPVIEGSEGGVKTFAEAKSICKEIGYPVLIKAGGGGGKGNEDCK